jgi:predicted O-methyltransferase YrrM
MNSKIPRIPKNYVRPKNEGLNLECPWMVPGSVLLLAKVINGSESVLDCGMGASTLFFSRRCAKVIGIESNLEWMSKVKTIAAERGLIDKISTIAVNNDSDVIAAFETLSDRSLDLISMDMQGKLFDRYKLLTQVVSKLKPSGIIVHDNYSHGHRFTDKNSVLKMLNLTNSHKAIDFDDPNWNGSGTRIILPNELYEKNISS